MKTDINFYGSYKLIYSSFVLLVSLMLAGCSSTTLVTRTYTEFIPPISEEGKTCLEKISVNLKTCQGRVEIEQQLCQKEAHITATQDLAQAEIKYQNDLAALKAQQLDERKKQELQLVNQQKEYADCLDRKKLQEAQLRNNTNSGSGQSITIKYVDSCTNPQLNGNYQTGIDSYSIAPTKPQLEDFIHDAQCYSSTKCEGDYNSHYEACGGKVLYTTRCFANCAGDVK